MYRKILKGKHLRNCIFNEFPRVLLNIQRTRKQVEWWHRSIKQVCIIHHPNIARFMELIKTQEETRFEFNQASTGLSINILNAD